MDDEEVVIPDFMPLEFTLGKRQKHCPKCGCPQLAGMTTLFQYHAAGVLGDLCEDVLGYPEILDLGQHIDRTCLVCSHRWVEQVDGTPQGLDE